jgi:trimeric autotransporter adhesin
MCRMFRKQSFVIDCSMIAAACVSCIANAATTANEPCQPYWSDAFPNGTVNGPVQKLAWLDDGTGPALYVGGNFLTAGGVLVNRIARWDIASRQFSSFGTGLNGTVFAVTVFDDGSGLALYAGGSFSMAGDVAVSNVARWDHKTGEWAPMGAGTNSAVIDLEVFDDGSGPALYAVGAFTVAGGVEANRIARWDGTEWSALGEGLNNSALTLAVGRDEAGNDSALYVGGSFTTAGGIEANRVARWDGESWSPLGEGVDALVRTLAVLDDTGDEGHALYVGGNFTTAGGIEADYVARWDSSTEAWSSLGSGVNSSVYDIAVVAGGSGPLLYVVGGFTMAGEVEANRVAAWDVAAGQWSPVGTGVDSFGAITIAIVDSGDGEQMPIIGGSFTQAGGLDANFFARWDGKQWSSVGGGLSGAGHNQVLSMEVFDDGDGPALYVGGNFTVAGGKPADRFAKWDGQTWSEVGGGTGGKTWALRAVHDELGAGLYVGGAFHSIGGTGTGGIGRWDGESWSDVGGGLDWVEGSGGGPPEVRSIQVFDDGSGPALYVGGFFDRAGELEVTGIARWDGEKWSSFAELTRIVDGQWEVPGAVQSLAVSEEWTTLFIGGLFGFVDDISSQNIAAYVGCPPAIPGDLNGDGVIDAADLLILLEAWGACPSPEKSECPADLNGNDVVDGGDLLILLSNWS